MDFVLEYRELIGAVIMGIISIYFKYIASKNKINQRKKKDDNVSKFDLIDFVLSYVIEFIEKRKSNKNSFKNLAEFTKLTRIIEAINRKYLPDIIGVVKVNGVEKLIIDLTKGNNLVELSKYVGTGLFQDANDELILNEGLYIPSVVNYKGDDKFAQSLHKHGFVEAYVIPFMDGGLMTGYLVLGYTTLNSKPQIGIQGFNELKTRINKITINFNKT